MPHNVYIVSSRLRLATEWMCQNEEFLKNYLNLEQRPHLLSTEGWRNLELLHGFPSKSLMILVDLPNVYLRQIKHMHPHYIFISCDLN